MYVTVRNFRTFDDKPEWHDTTLFLDGLDESRAGTEDGRSSLDDIRKKLERLRMPALSGCLAGGPTGWRQPIRKR